MEYLEMKLRDRLVADPAQRSARAEEDLFYDSFADTNAVLGLGRSLLLVWRHVLHLRPRLSVGVPELRKEPG